MEVAGVSGSVDVIAGDYLQQRARRCAPRNAAPCLRARCIKHGFATLNAIHNSQHQIRNR